jgi:large subunit ribosomal protein L6
VGVGYRAEKTGDKLMLRLGFSHQVEVIPMPGLTLAVEGNNKIKVSGINKEDVGQMAAEIRALKPPDHYKGKGIRYTGEKVHIKPGKTGKVVSRQ